MDGNGQKNGGTKPNLKIDGGEIANISKNFLSGAFGAEKPLLGKSHQNDRGNLISPFPPNRVFGR